jgi:uncharacterized membrane protein
MCCSKYYHSCHHHYPYTILNTAGTEYSIANFGTDLTNYLTTGIFGLQKGIGLNLIIFMIIFLTVGIVSWKFGIHNPSIIAGMVCVMTMLFDSAVLNLIYYFYL